MASIEPALAFGEYRYEIRSGGELVATEVARCAAGQIRGIRKSADILNRHEVDAELTPDFIVRRMAVRYSRGPFERSATYESDGDYFRGSVVTLSARDAVIAKLGRFREVDGDLILFKALILAHLRARGDRRWTGRVAVIDRSTLVASSQKQTWRQRDSDGRRWTIEPRLGERDELELDALGRVLRYRDSSGAEAVLV